MNNLKGLWKNRSFSNMLWLIGDSVFRLGLGFFVSVWLARFLGPDGFGIYNYSFALIAVATAFAALGMNGVIVKELVRDPQKKDVLMGSSFGLQLIGGVMSSIAIVLILPMLRPNDSEVALAMLLMIPSVLFRATDVIKYWFEAQIASKYTVVAQNVAFLLGASAKILLILASAPYWAIAATVSLEAFILAVMLIFIYKRERSFDWTFDIAEAKRLFGQSWPLVLSGVAFLLYMRIDQIMIGNLIGDAEVGVYSVAIKLSEVWYFIPVAITSSLFPRIMLAKHRDAESYVKKMQFLYDVLVLLAVVLAVIVTLFASTIVDVFFGERYSRAAGVSSIYAWAGVFYFLSSASGRWYINEGLQMYALSRNLLGLGVAVGLNFLLIPKFGSIGAAWSTLIAFGCAAYFFDAFSKKTRISFIQKTRALWLPSALIRVVRELKR